LPAEGGWYGILQIPATRPEEEWVLRLLAEDGVAVHPGYFYDFPREAFLVLSLLPPEPSFAAAAAAIVRRVAAEA
jgi:aspartate/methionine/tyrosine aminotransferase